MNLDDHSRVKLSSEDRDGRGNYINANYVDVRKRRNLRVSIFVCLSF